MKSRNVFSRADVVRANEALRKTLSAQTDTGRQAMAKSSYSRLSAAEINRAFTAAKKVLAEV